MTLPAHPLVFGLDLSTAPDITAHTVFEIGKPPLLVRRADNSPGNVSQSEGDGGFESQECDGRQTGEEPAKTHTTFLGSGVPILCVASKWTS